jgi:plastocyanin domain-containing protein
MRSRSRGVAAAAFVTFATAVALGCHKDDAVATGARLDVVADERGFTPSSVEVKMGSPLTLVFTRTTDDTCANQVVFPELKVTKDLPLKQPVAVDVPSGAARTLAFQCGMGMFKGKVVIR